MSSYRSSYTPWKSSLPSTYKTGTSSAYSSRDDVSSTPRYSSSLASPTSYRPSFSGGTYRLKRDTTSVPATSSYVSRYASSSSSGISSISKPESSSISDTMSSKSSSQLKRYGSTSSSLGKWSREPSPAALEHTNRIRSRDPSPATRSLRGISRDPSPSLDSKSKIGYSALSSYRMNVPKGPPPTSYNTRYSSSSAIRTPSTSSLADKSISYLTASDFRARTISKTIELAERKSNEKELESAPPIVVVEAPQAPSKQQEKQEEASEDSDTTEESDTSEDEDEEDTEPPEQFIAIEVCTRGTSPTPPGASPSVQMARRVDIAKTVEKTMLRSTKKRKMIEKEMQSDRLDDSTKYSRYGLNSRLSPYSTRSDRYSPSNLRYSTSPLSTTSKSTSLSTNESRREDSTTSSSSAARVLKSPVKISNENRHEDSTTSSSSEARALKSPVMKRNESRRADSTNSSSSATRALKSPVMISNENRREDSTTSSSSATRALKSPVMKRNEGRREDSITSSSSAGRALKSSVMKSKLSPPKVSKMKSRQSSMESLSPHKPPVSPKADSPHKSSSSSNSPNLSTTKLPNKDFRKSSLNVGSTDQPRKSRTPSTGNDSDYNTVDALNGALQAIQRLERSPSAGSEVSNVSSRSIRSRNLTESKLRPRCHSKPLGSSTPPSPLSRQNSGTNFKQKTSTPLSPLVTRSTKIAVKAAISSSSGTDSSAEVKKPLKKIVKKKSIKETSSSNASTTTSLSSHSTSESQSISEKLPTQPPVAPTAAAGGKAKKSESSVAKKSNASTRSEKDPLRRLKKLSSVSNFFVTQQKNTNSDEQIYLESSETSGGGGAGASGGSASTDLDLGSSKSSKLSKKSGSITRTNEPKTSTTKTTKSNSSTSASNCNSPVNHTRDSANERPNRIATKSSSKSTTQSVKSKSKSKSRSASDTSSSYCPQNSSTLNESSKMPTELESESVSPYASTNTATTSTTGTDSEEPSWWQDTSQQIDTSSALDFSFKDEMRFKVRHIDSGEVGWWLRNDDNDTIADDLATLNQDEVDEEVDDDNSDPLKTDNELAFTEINDKALGWRVTENNEPRSNDGNEKDQLNYKTNGYCTEPEDTESRPFPRSRLSPETDWWQDEEEEAESNVPQPKSSETSPAKQNGSIQLKICRVESGEQPWWVDDSGTIDTEVEEKPEIPIEAVQPVMKQPTPESSETTSNPTSASKKWWMAGPTKKLFNIPRVESGEKAWWQDDRSEKDSNRSKSRDQDRVSSNNSRSDQEQVQTVKLSKVPRAESSEKAWWLEEGSDKDNKRSKSRDQEPKSSSNSRSDQEQVQTVKLSKVPRAESSEKAWWLEEGSDKDNKRSKSRDHERWPNADNAANRDARSNEYYTQSPPNGDQAAWRENSNGYQQGELTQIKVYSPTIKGQKERWLQENNRKYSEPSDNGYYTQVQLGYPETSQDSWLEDTASRPYTRQTSLQSYHSNPDDEEVQQFNQHSNALPAPVNRAESQTELSNSFNFEYSERPPPLGQCASPVQHEEEPPSRSPPHSDSQRTSPHDNIPMTKVQQTPTTPPNQLPILPGNVNNNNGHADVPPPAYLQNLQLSQQQQSSLAQQQQHFAKQTSPKQQYNNNDLCSKNTQLFISRHQNIDELLSGSCRPLSPLFFDNGSFQTMPTQQNMFLEEVTPDQVRIHDSTAQVPFIQRMERDDWERNSQVATNSISPPRFEQRVMNVIRIKANHGGNGDVGITFNYSNLKTNF